MQTIRLASMLADYEGVWQFGSSVKMHDFGPLDTMPQFLN